MLKTFKAQDEYIWTEYIKFINMQILIQNAKKHLIEVDGMLLKDFVVQDADFGKICDSLYIEINEAMLKRMHSIMTLGWYNDM